MNPLYNAQTPQDRRKMDRRLARNTMLTSLVVAVMFGTLFAILIGGDFENINRLTVPGVMMAITIVSFKGAALSMAIFAGVRLRQCRNGQLDYLS